MRRSSPHPTIAPNTVTSAASPSSTSASLGRRRHLDPCRFRPGRSHRRLRHHQAHPRQRALHVPEAAGLGGHRMLFGESSGASTGTETTPDQPANPVPDWLQGWWDVRWRGQSFYYYFDRSREVTWTQIAPLDRCPPLPRLQRQGQAGHRRSQRAQHRLEQNRLDRKIRKPAQHPQHEGHVERQGTAGRHQDVAPRPYALFFAAGRFQRSSDAGAGRSGFSSQAA